MPIYEYRCGQCGKKSSILLLSYREPVQHQCPHCGSADLHRIISRFATMRSTDARLESLADPSTLADLDERDPASMARYMKRMGRELGDELGEDFNEAVDEALETEDVPPGGTEGGGPPFE